MIKNKSKSNFYFGKKEEEYVKKYVKSKNSEERNAIYTNDIFPVFSKLVENIIFRYDFLKLGNTYKELHQEVMAHLYINIDKFNPDYGTKAYSYFGTAAKRYLQQKSINKDYETKNVESINFLRKSDHNHNLIKKDVMIIDDIVVEQDIQTEENKEFINVLIKYFENKKGKNNDENRIIEAVHYFLKNYEGINIHNKKHMYILLREYTGLDTKTITRILNNVIITLYNDLKHKYINYEL